jgi:aspartate racemase
MSECLHIGIVACSAEGASLCYRTICTEGAALLGAHAHPEVSLHGEPFSDYVDCLERDDWAGVASLMLSSAEKLARTGADFLICPDNTIHAALALVEARSPKPWLHIAEVVAAKAAERRFRRVGLTGTRWLVDSEVYPDKLAPLGIGYLRPAPAERDAINRIIMDELVRGVTTSHARAYLAEVIGRFKREGCDAVVLGCTELPLLIDDSASPLPTLDSTRELARAALRLAVRARA